MITVKTEKKAKYDPYQFPKLMISNVDKTIVLFTGPSCGTIIWAPNEIEIGHTSSGFSPNAFTDYNEPITIQNA